MKKGATRRFTLALVTLALPATFTMQGTAQNAQATRKSAGGAVAARSLEHDRPLVLTGAATVDGAKGGFDHFAAGGGRIFVSERNNAIFIFTDLGGSDRTITGVPAPQGLAFSPEANKLFAGSATGKVYVYDGKSFDLITTVDFPGGADNLRYDAENKRVYVGCGNDEKTGAICALDAMTNQRLEEEYKLGDEPESFQLEKSGPNIYVNVPGLKQIVVINRATKAITRWPLTGIALNFPMALDEADHRLFVGTRAPARLAVFDTTSGHMVAELPGVVESDDLYYDADHKRLYMPGGEGFIFVFQMIDPDHYRLLTKVPTALGARTAGFFGAASKGQSRFYLAVPAHGSQSAEIRIYTVQ